MKRKYVFLFILIMLAALVTGCIRVHSNITINDDGSGNWQYIIAISDELMAIGELQEDEDAFEEMKQEAIQEGLNVENYQEDGYSGLIISQDFSDLTEVNATNFIENFSEEEDMLTQENIAAIFEPNILVSDSFLYTTYTINMDLNNVNTAEDLSSEAEINADEFDNLEDLGDIEDFEMFGDMMGNMFDIKFNLDLPKAPSNHNATIAENNDKLLSWDLVDEDVSSIYVEFKVLNRTDLILLILVALTTLVLILFIISRVKGRKMVNF
ncbi:MAG: hypothetical protein ACOC2J_05205 [bacterium]